MADVKPAKKRKRDHAPTAAANGSAQTQRPAAGPSSTPVPDSAAAFKKAHRPQKPSAKARVGTGRPWTLSVALPGSILVNAQSDELKAILAAQIARTCAIFNVSEVVIFHEDLQTVEDDALPKPSGKARGTFRKTKAELDEDVTKADALLASLLEMLETPQYLRRALIPMSPSLRLAGLLPPLDMPHHLRREDESPYREGVTVAMPEGAEPSNRPWVNVGLNEPVEARSTVELPLNTRVTVKMAHGGKDARLVGPRVPTETAGLSWGYTVRMASSLGTVFSESPYLDESRPMGYDLTIGTSERGRPVADCERQMPPFRHALVVLGGLAGLELSIAAQKDVFGLEASAAGELFDHYVNVCPGQGSRTIRSEEALMIALARLKPAFESRGIRPLGRPGGDKASVASS